MGKFTWRGTTRIMPFPFSAKLPHSLAVAAALLCGGAPVPAIAANNAASTEIVQVNFDQATLIKLDRPAAEVVVGNPSIADVSVQSGKVLVVTGKSFGETNLIVIDADGKVVTSRRLIVQEARAGLVTVYRGGADGKVTLSCAPYCTPPLVIGDDVTHFENLGKETKSKQSISQNSAEGSKQQE